MTDLLQPFLVGGATRPDAISGMDSRFSSALSQMFAAAPPEIQHNMRVMSGYRSPEVQAGLWANALKKYGSPEAARKWVAPPGHSMHNKGFASDLRYLDPAATKWAHDNASKFGLAFPLANENWHVELAGQRGHQHSPQPGQAPMQQVANGYDPVAEVMNAAQPQQPGAMPGLGDLFGGAAQNPDPLAGQYPQPADGSLGSLAMMFAAQQQERQKKDEEDAQAEQIRRAALFGQQQGPSVYG